MLANCNLRIHRFRLFVIHCVEFHSRNKGVAKLTNFIEIPRKDELAVDANKIGVMFLRPNSILGAAVREGRWRLGWRAWEQ
jgi:hypothetical protein